MSPSEIKSEYIDRGVHGELVRAECLRWSLRLAVSGVFIQRRMSALVIEFAVGTPDGLVSADSASRIMIILAAPERCSRRGRMAQSPRRPHLSQVRRMRARMGTAPAGLLVSPTTAKARARPAGRVRATPIERARQKMLGFHQRRQAKLGGDEPIVEETKFSD